MIEDRDPPASVPASSQNDSAADRAAKKLEYAALCVARLIGRQIAREEFDRSRVVINNVSVPEPDPD